MNSIATAIFIIFAFGVAFFVGYEVGRDRGIEIGRKQTYTDWANKIRLDHIEDEYVDGQYVGWTPTLVDAPKWKIRFRRKHRKPIIDMERWQMSKQYFGDWIEVKKPDGRRKRFSKAYIKKMVKELADELGIDMKEDVKD